METTAKSLETNTLLPNSNTSKKWNSKQVVLICVVVVVITSIATNIDRFISNNSSSSSNTIIDCSTNNAEIEFGHNILQCFTFNDTYTNLNFGSFGSAPKYVLNKQYEKRVHIENCPDCWYRDALSNRIINRTPTIIEIQKLMSKYLGIENWMDLVLIINTSHGINAVLRSLSEYFFNNISNQTNSSQCHSNYKILHFSTAYPMVKDTLLWLNSNIASPNNQLIEFEIETQMLYNTSYLLDTLEIFLNNTFSNGTVIYLACITHIGAFPSNVFDVKEITKLFRKYNIITVIDAAHSMGQININLTDIDPDVYISNGHKWLYSSHGSAIMYIKSELQDKIFPTCFSGEGVGNNTFQLLFNYVGTMDYTSFITMEYALQFRQNIGGEDKIINYLHNLAINAGELLCNMWNTTLLIPNEMYYAAMINVVSPTQNKTKFDNITMELYNKYNTWIPSSDWNGILYWRLSTQIFLELSDFEMLGSAVLELLEQ